jgi:hypothetical protein
MQPLCLPDEPRTADVGQVQRGLTRLFTEAATEGVRDVVLVIGRPGKPAPTPRDHDLRAAFENACRSTGVRLLGVAIAAPDAVAAFPSDGPVAA